MYHSFPFICKAFAALIKNTSLFMKHLFALITLTILFGIVSPLLAQNTKEKSLPIASALAQTKEKRYRLWYATPAPNRGSDYATIKAGGKPFDEDWENWSLPIGNGYFGASLFGRTDTERIQITENSLSNKGMWAIGSLTSFAEIFIDCNHPNPQNYTRSLDISKGASFVQYDYNDVHYSREYFASYPDKVLVIKLKSNKKGALSFTLRPTIPYCKPYGATPGDNDGRSGKVIAQNNVLTLSGHMDFYNIDYEGQIKVLPFGGKLKETVQVFGFLGMEVCGGACGAVAYVGRVGDAGLVW
jgi:alpha-L-fucosidase 2